MVGGGGGAVQNTFSPLDAPLSSTPMYDIFWITPKKIIWPVDLNFLLILYYNVFSVEGYWEVHCVLLC